MKRVIIIAAVAACATPQTSPPPPAPWIADTSQLGPSAHPVGSLAEHYRRSARRSSRPRTPIAARTPSSST